MLIDPRKVWTKKAVLKYYNTNGASEFLKGLQSHRDREWERQFYEISPLSEIVFFLDEALQEITLNPYTHGWNISSSILRQNTSTIMLIKNSTKIAIEWEDIEFDGYNGQFDYKNKQTTHIWYGANYFYSAWVFDDNDGDDLELGELDMFLSSDYGIHTLGFLLSVRYLEDTGNFKPILSAGLPGTTRWAGQFQQNISEAYSYEKAIQQASSFLDTALYFGQDPDNPEFTRSW